MIKKARYCFKSPSRTGAHVDVSIGGLGAPIPCSCYCGLICGLEPLGGESLPTAENEVGQQHACTCTVHYYTVDITSAPVNFTLH